MKDGMISIDSSAAKKIGFTSDKFDPTSYLWKDGDRIIISLITSREQKRGYFTSLVNKIHNEGFKVAVPVPSNMMVNFLIKNQFIKTYEETQFDVCEIWIKG